MGTAVLDNARRLRAIGLKACVCALPLLLVAGCAAFPSMSTNVVRPDGTSTLDGSSDPTAANNDARQQTRSINALQIPGQTAPVQTRPPATEAQIAALVPDEMVDATLGPQSIPQFSATVFGGLLGLPYTLTPDVATRVESIAGGSGGTISKRDLFRLTQQALARYGIDVFIDGGFVTVGSAETSNIGAELARSRIAPTGSGRVVQFFSVQTIEVNAIQPLIQQLFPNLGGAQITPDQLSNSLIISGSARDVANVVRVLREIDQPRFAGAEALQIEPVFLSADNLATSLEQVLITEGYVVSRTPTAGRAITILSFPLSNQILAFTRDPELAARVRYWINVLDAPATLGDRATTFVYQVRNTDAKSLGQLAIGQSPEGPSAQRPVGVPGTPPQFQGQGNGQGQGQGLSRDSGAQGGAAAGQFQSGRLTTDPIGNRILFTGTATDYEQLKALLDQLDRPAPQVVIEVIIAEVTLDDATELGVQFSGNETTSDGDFDFGSNPGALGALGASLSFIGPDLRAEFNAFASNRKVNILSRPRLVSRSGGEARFQVGNDIPIITSQRATDFDSGVGDGNDVLQTVQYRQTGVILTASPIVYGDRVDILINQEISTVANTTSGGIASPTIGNRSIDTQVSVGDGWTAVLGGLISNEYNKTNLGVPFLKDIPIVGSLFQSNSVGGTRTEILILLTPHIIRDDYDMSRFVDGYSRDMDAAFRTGRGYSYTLTPFSFGGVRGIGFDLPRVNPTPIDRTSPPVLSDEIVPPPPAVRVTPLAPSAAPPIP